MFFWSKHQSMNDQTDPAPMVTIHDPEFELKIEPIDIETEDDRANTLYVNCEPEERRYFEETNLDENLLDPLAIDQEEIESSGSETKISCVKVIPICKRQKKEFNLANSQITNFNLYLPSLIMDSSSDDEFIEKLLENDANIILHSANLLESMPSTSNDFDWNFDDDEVNPGRSDQHFHDRTMTENDKGRLAKSFMEDDDENENALNEGNTDEHVISLNDSKAQKVN